MRQRLIIVIATLGALAALAGCSLLGGQNTPLTNWEPELSPDGTRLVYESPIDQTLELFLRDLETEDEIQLTSNEHDDWSPSWSPESDRIAFVSRRNDNNDIYVLDIASGETTRLTTHEADDINPSWGVDGRIYFNSNRSETWEIFVIDPDGANLVRLTNPEPLTES